MSLERAQEVLKKAMGLGAQALLETEGLDLLKALGIKTPQTIFVAKNDIAALESYRAKISSSKVVIKVISRQILHKSDVGGVEIVDNDAQSVQAAFLAMDARLSSSNVEGCQVEGYTLSECVQYSGGLRSEILFGLKFTADFGPVVTLSAGGIYTEFLAKSFRRGKDLRVFSAEQKSDPKELAHSISQLAASELWLKAFRGQEPLVKIEEIVGLIQKLSEFAKKFVPHWVSEFEMNPVVATSRGLVALDVLCKLGTGSHPHALDIESAQSRPVDKIKNLLLPKSVAIVGVSEKLNPGHIILNNLLREGFDARRIYIVKPKTATIEDCLCVPDIASLPEKVDLLVLAVSAAQVAQAIEDVIQYQKAESVVIIPGGLEEKQGGEKVSARISQLLADSRKLPWRGPLLNGGNCLGVKSVPGKFDTMFIPEYKIGNSKAKCDPVAFISQSGALAISRANKLSASHFRYSISVGNQSDLTVGDYLEFLRADPSIQTFAVYVEGFKPFDGLKFLRAAREIKKSGRNVLLYRSGRTQAGAKASASHTASIAGDYAITLALCEDAGVVLADTLEDFDDFIELFTLLNDRKARGFGLGAISNAGFECVAIGDRIGPFELVDFSPDTAGVLNRSFSKARIDGIVDIHNPLDLTPMAADEAYEQVTQAVLEDPAVDIGIVACIPLTPALNTLPRGFESEDLTSPDAIVSRLCRVWQSSLKPWVVVVDAGTLYDPMAQALKAAGIPTFRTVDRAMRLLGVFSQSVNV